MSIFNREIRPDLVEHVEPCLEARTVCRNLGLDVDNEHWDKADVGDFIRLAYAGGYKACEARLASRDVADGIARAMDLPESILERDANESDARWKVRAVQQVVAYGVPK